MIFGLKIYYFAYNSKTTRRAKLKFEHNVGAYKCFNANRVWERPSRDQNFTGRKWAET